MRKALASAAAIFGLAFALPAASQATVTTGTAQLNLTPFVSCANNGTGELVHVTGTLNFRNSTFTDENGGLHHTTLIRPQGVTAVGLTTGTKYQFVSLSKDVFNQKVGSVLTSVNVFRIIGPGPGNDMFEHNLLHITVSPDGTVTADFFQVNSGCT